MLGELKMVFFFLKPPRGSSSSRTVEIFLCGLFLHLVNDLHDSVSFEDLRIVVHDSHNAVFEPLKLGDLVVA